MALPGAQGAPIEIALTLLRTSFAICRLPPTAPVPEWTGNAHAFLTISRSRDELSIIADDAAVPQHIDARRGYRAITVDGPLPLDLVGILVAILAPLAEAGIPILAVATFDTDYVLVHEDALLRALAALEAAGHRLKEANHHEPT